MKNESCRSLSPIQNKEDTIFIALQLFLIARIGFQAVSRVLKVIGHYLGFSKTPCTQTIVNWVIRLSIARTLYPKQLINSNVPFSNGTIAIIDISITLGADKILTALFLVTFYHYRSEDAPTLQDVSYAAVAVAPSWTGETVANFWQDIIKTMGKPAAYLKDGGTELAKAIRLLGEPDCSSPSIDDISHVIANLFKHEYQDHPMFETFLEACGKVSKNFKQTLTACLIPPKVSTYAQFMNLHRLVRWAEQLLKHSPKGRAQNGSLLLKLRASIEQIPQCQAFINRFLRDANPLLAWKFNTQNKRLKPRHLPRMSTIGGNNSTAICCAYWCHEFPRKATFGCFSPWLGQNRNANKF